MARQSSCTNDVRLGGLVVRIEERVRARHRRRIAEQERGDAVAADAGAVVGQRGREGEVADRRRALELTGTRRDTAPAPTLMLWAPRVLVTEPLICSVLSIVISGMNVASPSAGVAGQVHRRQRRRDLVDVRVREAELRC